ncbi:putative protein MJ1089 [Proteiniborus sp. DW1]|uniref:cobalt ECF transporter T component CbiQ n=1 Tax=Proteiniborus sp. DW1 TaxID=1889883 RepID=UPI00092DF054|nr:cobalt ECF transporter T component CbiQ [Proteiniborus sp. DW1]SCG82176.1 putative protein MJ1089 [Proteiniborus sp. DW1]
MPIVDKFAYTNKLKDFSPMVKFSLAIGLLIVTLINKIFYIHIGIIFFMFFITVIIAGIPLKFYLKICKGPIFFLFLGLIAILFSITQNPIESMWGIELLGLNIIITNETINSSISIFLRALSAVLCSLFLILTTPINDLVYIFRKMKVPKTFIEMTVLIYRFIFILLEEMRDIHMAQEIRFGYSSLGNSYKSLSLLITLLFIRVMKRYEDMEISLKSRVFNDSFWI